MPSASYGVSLSVGGVSIAKSVLRTGDHPNSYEVSLPVGFVVTSWVKTDANTAACNLPSGHGYTNGNFDVYFPAGIRYGVPGTIVTNALTLDGGAGVDFPASATTGVVVTKQVSVNTAIDGDAILIIGIVAEASSPSSVALAHIDMQDVGLASIEEMTLQANVPKVWDITGGASNVFTGNPITSTKASNGSSTEVLTLKIVSLEDSTP